MRLVLPLGCATSVCLAACIFSPSYEDTHYQCTDGQCPDGYECVSDYCEPIGRDASFDAVADADVIEDSGPDAKTDADETDAAACDPASQPHNDTCAQAILLTSGIPTCGDTSDHTNVHDIGTACMTTTTTIGPDAVYEITASAGQEISVVMTPDGWDGEVYLVDDCTAYSSCLEGSARVGVGVPEDFTYTAQSGDDGTDYFIIVDGATAVQYGEFTLSVTVE